jgi:hemerythrin
MTKGSTIKLQNMNYCKDCKKRYKRNAGDLRPQKCDDCLKKYDEETKQYLDKLVVTIEDHFNKKDPRGPKTDTEPDDAL